VAMYDVDLFDVSASQIAGLKAQGRDVICYFSAGSYEDWRPDANQFPASALGRSNGWPGERWLDIRNATVRDIMKHRLDLAVQNDASLRTEICAAGNSRNFDTLIKDLDLSAARTACR